ncbi:hypothetical protein H5410_061539 [Solanum commersonii]|uniref:At2g35280-like TPR domain-containing protein n=1 Tax=Solanum commersonii TaxID=4109 RepID=A0A9J5W846_SOLCO|nr:hypothetical protein H5410_061539 [Solanum commersonii]
MLNDELDGVDMNNHDAEIGKDEVTDFERNNPPTPIVGSNIPCSSQSSRVNNVRDDETGFYKGMTFKNKEELANSLKIACLKNDFRLKKYFENRLSNGKGPSTRDISNQLHTELGCKVSYWKIYKGMEHAKSNVRGTHEHGYTVLNVYRYMLEVANPGSKTALSLDENGRFKYFFEVTHFYKAAKASDRCEFNDHFNQIRDLLPKVAETLVSIGFHTWSRAFCPGNRCNIMTSNIIESVNSMFDVEREFPIVALFDEINRRFALLFHQRRMELVNSANRFVSSIEKDISKEKYLLRMLIQANLEEGDIRDGVELMERKKKMTRSKKNYESLQRELLIDIVEMIASYSLKDLMRVKLRVLNQVANKPSVYQKVTLVNFPYRRWLIVQDAISFLEMCRASGNLEALYRKGVFDFFNRNDLIALGIINQAADGGHIGASYVLAIISIFNGGESMREGLMFIANMKKTEPLKVRRCRQNLQNILGEMWVLEPNLLGGRPIC